MEIRVLNPGDGSQVMAAGGLFDRQPSSEWTSEFLDRSGHHLLVGFEDDVPIGFVTGVELVHPDKRPEMLLYELGVDEAFRGRGAGRALVKALRDRARQTGCRGMWVVTTEDNEAAVRTYRSAGAAGQSDAIVLEWDLDEGGDPSGVRP